MSQSMQGKHAVVTGATSGIGTEIARELARRGARVTIVARSPEKAGRLAAELDGSGHRTVTADFESLGTVAAAAGEIATLGDPVDVLVNNAGVVMLGRTSTADGYETTFAVNHLAPFLLTTRLESALADGGRVVTTASDAHRIYGKRVDFDALDGGDRYRAMPHYGLSKLCNILFTRRLAKNLASRGITATSYHPGMVSTQLATNNGTMAKIAWAMLRPFSRTPAKGAETGIYLACEAEGGDASSSGAYFYNSKQRKPAAFAVRDDDADRLWETSDALTASF